MPCKREPCLIAPLIVRSAISSLSNTYVNTSRREIIITQQDAGDPLITYFLSISPTLFRSPTCRA